MAASLMWKQGKSASENYLPFLNGLLVCRSRTALYVHVRNKMPCFCIFINSLSHIVLLSSCITRK